jgi:hypothetical protein
MLRQEFSSSATLQLVTLPDGMVQYDDQRQQHHLKRSSGTLGKLPVLNC